MRKRWRPLPACLAVVLLAGCGGGSPPPPVPAREFDDPGFVVSGGFELRYATIQASSLPAEVSTTYGIPPRSDVLVINVSILRRVAGSLPVATEATVGGSWHSLTGQPQALDFRAVNAAGSVSYVAEAPLRDREPIVLELAATPAATTTALRARLTRRFDVD